ncbi:AMP-binding protein [Pseudonocardia kujensis]|uniref:AMP-binding protein n=1 Tax=Pseudonocardia kujensis TaxID=1128675 RepID=UPI001E433C87|nr:AMP-binding protein [Pseudonocardia kujensis]MCE0768404.1 AMP-binding protein [Pseudonocardia kujensis]
MQPSPSQSPGTGSDAVAHLGELVRRAARRDPAQPAVVDVTAGRTLTWAELDAAADAEAARLAAAGIAAGDRVVLVLPNGAGFCVALFGALRAGAIAVPVGQRSVAREVAVILDDARPAAVVTDAGVAADAARAAGVPVLDPPPVEPQPAGPPPEAPGGEAIALLIYTSGTTGRPRGVQLSHRALLANRAQTAALRPAPVTPADRVLLALPLFHSFGLAAGLLQVCWAGATAVLTARFDAAATPAILRDHRVSALAGVPSLYRALLDVPAEDLRGALEGVRICTSGGAPLPPAWLTAFREATGMEVLEGYGLSEAGPVVTCNVPGHSKPGSVGRPLPGVELRLVDAEGDPLGGRTAEEGEEGDAADVFSDPEEDTGMVALRGPNLFSGYWPSGEGGPDADGWFRTADVGYLDADGDLHLVDRSTDLVIVNGFNVYPREVEEVLAGMAEVAEVAVVGVPDDRTGAAVKAVIVPAPGTSPDVGTVQEYCATRLARFKRPTVIAFVDELPRTPTGKIARRVLAETGTA